jgi:polyvinyl alcohol dehydrogenase (cytochrome)
MDVRHQRKLTQYVLAALLAGLTALASHPPGAAFAATTTSWPMFQGDIGHSGYNSAETILNATSVRRLRTVWTAQAGGGISGEAAVANGVIYWGSWDGYLHATTVSGVPLWRAFLGKTNVPSCFPPSAGVADTPTVTTIGGQPAVIVAGGDAVLYALNARTGRVIWQTRLGNSPAHFLWSSPTIYAGAIYIGISSFGDCPLVLGGLAKLSLADGKVEAIFHTTSGGCLGASIWGTPVVDPSTGNVYAATGNVDTTSVCKKGTQYGTSILALALDTLALVDHWQVPSSQLGFDQDFGATPTLFTGYTYGYPMPMIGVASKNGWFYAFDRTYLSQGPLWQQRVADVGGDCSYCGEGSLSSGAFDGTAIYVGGGKATINGQHCLGNVSALDPATGAYIWRRCLEKPVQNAVTAAPGIVVFDEGTTIDVVNASDGSWLIRLTDRHSNSAFMDGASIVNGHIYVGNMDGILYACGLAGG